MRYIRLVHIHEHIPYFPTFQSRIHVGILHITFPWSDCVGSPLRERLMSGDSHEMFEGTRIPNTCRTFRMPNARAAEKHVVNPTTITFLYVRRLSNSL